MIGIFCRVLPFYAMKEDEDIQKSTNVNGKDMITMNQRKLCTIAQPIKYITVLGLLRNSEIWLP